MKIVVTGSSSGIGRALAARLIERGHLVWGLARSDQAEFAAAHPGKFFSSRCDVAQAAPVAAVVSQVESTWGTIDGLVCCAGWQGEVGRALGADPARWCETVRSNIEGAYLPIRTFHRLLGRRGKVVAFSGGGSTQARPNFSAYGSAKTAIVRMVETIAAEEGGSLDINAVAPGAVATAMTEEVLRLGPAQAGQSEIDAARRSLEKAASPDRAIALVEWLLSAESDGVTGRLLSAPWDPWPFSAEAKAAMGSSDQYKLRRKTN